MFLIRGEGPIIKCPTSLLTVGLFLPHYTTSGTAEVMDKGQFKFDSQRNYSAFEFDFSGYKSANCFKHGKRISIQV
jgi:hypothetical protein